MPFEICVIRLCRSIGWSECLIRVKSETLLSLARSLIPFVSLTKSFVTHDECAQHLAQPKVGFYDPHQNCHSQTHTVNKNPIFC